MHAHYFKRQDYAKTEMEVAMKVLKKATVTKADTVPRSHENLWTRSSYSGTPTA